MGKKTINYGIESYSVVFSDNNEFTIFPQPSIQNTSTSKIQDPGGIPMQIFSVQVE